MLLFSCPFHDDAFICDGESTESEEEKSARDNFPAYYVSNYSRWRHRRIGLSGFASPVREATYTRMERTVPVSQPAWFTVTWSDYVQCSDFRKFLGLNGSDSEFDILNISPITQPFPEGECNLSTPFMRKKLWFLLGKCASNNVASTHRVAISND